MNPSGIVDLLAPIAVGGSVLTIVVVSVLITVKWRQGSPITQNGALLPFIAALFVAVVVGGAGAAFMDGREAVSADQRESVPQPRPNAGPAPDAGADPDWDVVLQAAGTGGAGLGVAALVFVITRSVSRKRAADGERAECEAKATAAWDSAVGRLDKLRDLWLSANQDIDQVLTYPVLTDVAEQQTAAFVEALGKATDLQSLTHDRDIDSVLTFSAAVQQAETAWQVAARNARQVRLSRFTITERRSIEKAQRLLAQALDTAASPQERRTYYERARDLLGDLIDLPSEAVQALESTVDLALPTPERRTDADIISPNRQADRL